MNKAPLKLLVIQLLVLLPAFYFAWYATGEYTASALAEVLKPLLGFLWPDHFYSLKTSGTDIVIYMQNLPRTGQGEASVLLSLADKGIIANPYTYSYGIPLFLALAIAAPATFWQYLLRIGIGLVVLYAGVCLSIVASIIYIMHETPDIQWPILALDPELNQALVEYIHFVGFLLVPRVLPLLMWVVLYRDSLAEIIRSLRSQPVTEEPSGREPPH